MNKFPSTISPCPILEAVVELRYNTKLPSEAVFGIIYNSINEIMPEEFSFAKLPILQLPEEIRSKDPSLKYSSYYTLAHHKLPITVNIGPYVITFINKKTYQGWDNYSHFISDIITCVYKSRVIPKYERIGVRYMNFFESSIIDKINCKFEMNGQEILELPTSIRTERNDKDGISIIQINNNTGIQIEGRQEVGSLIDIDYIYTIKEEIDSPSILLEKITFSHDREKEIFFNLLKPDFIDSLNPVY